MIIKTRYRDIPQDEVNKCRTEAGRAAATPRDGVMTFRPGAPVNIETPGVSRSELNAIYLACDGPFYFIAGTARKFAVCPHIAEIGD